MPTNESSTPRDEVATPALSASEFFLNTSPEMDALERAAADGKYDRNYQDGADNMGDPTWVHRVPGGSHSVRLALTDSEKMLGGGKEMLENLARSQDADGALAFLYISHLLAPPAPLAPNTTTAAKIEFDDVLKKIGWVPQTTVERRQMHQRLFEYLRFCERAEVYGTRTTTYIDKHSGEVVPTVIRSSLWRISSVERPKEGSNYPNPEIPVAVELVISREWAMLLTSANTAQYLPMGEVLGAIPGAKPSGAWARVIGLSLASFWRRRPREALDGTIKPTRKELLTRYPPKTGTVEDLLASKDPRFAIDYWCGAMKILKNAGLIEPVGEALADAKTMKGKYPRKGWSTLWLNECVEIVPGDGLRDVVSQRAKNKPALKKPMRRKKSQG